MRTLPRTRMLLCAVVMTAVPLLAPANEPAAVSFERDIRPILSENCFHCHGPDEETREAGLRLDLRAEALKSIRGRAPVVPGAPEQSELFRRISTTDPHDLMPPAESKKQLTPVQIALVERWIAEGADWPEHWAFLPPQRPVVPGVRDGGWARNPIDAFIYERMAAEGLAPSPEADPITLLRRLSLDITGLPPTPEEVSEFLAADLDQAYGAAAQRLLDSPHYGERWARHWLDAAQFADSDGFEKDKPRQVWAWRDWVIDALNANKAYDVFVREQIAGDLLPEATQDQMIATGFLRNSMINEEGGIDPEQFRMEAVFNRMDVIGRAVLGLTVQCAQCHTHKYDPLSHTDYYRMLAYINNSYEACMTVYSAEESAQRDAVLAKVSALEQELKAANPDWDDELAAWEETLRAEPRPQWHTLDLLFDDTSSGGQKFLPMGDGSYLAAGYAPTRFAPKMSAPAPVRTVSAIRLELLPDPNLPRGGPGRSVFGTGALSEFDFRLAPEGAEFQDYDKWEKVPVASAIADVNIPRRRLPEHFQIDAKRKVFTGPVKMAIDGDAETAWDLDAGPGRSNVPRYAIFKLAAPVEVPEGMKLALRLQQNHGGNNSDDNQNNNLGRFRLSVTDSETLPDRAVPEAVREIVERGRSGRSAGDAAALFSYWRSTEPRFGIMNLAIERAWRDHPPGATQLVYRERQTPRVTHRLERGDFLSPAEPVEPGVPAFLNPIADDAAPNRLSLAEWMTDESAPTTARAFVNRVWQHHFGTGLVDTPADFGLQGAAPSHPQLLDWLAVEFMSSGWDIKALHRLIVTSATYRQSSRVTPELLERDPSNRLLARGARYRVEGEIVRDIALAASGLLDRTVGGPSVYPVAPAFLFEPPASYGPKPWNFSAGGDRFRRGLYTFRYRSVPHPALQAFDTPPGDAPCVRRNRSNTPLQALTTLNEPMFNEAARALAALTMQQGGENDESRLRFAFRRCVSRDPTQAELDTLARFHQKQRERMRAGELDAAAILEAEDPAALKAQDSVNFAAFALTARVLLNMDETISRE